MEVFASAEKRRVLLTIENEAKECAVKEIKLRDSDEKLPTDTTNLSHEKVEKTLECTPQSRKIYLDDFLSGLT